MVQKHFLYAFINSGINRKMNLIQNINGLEWFLITRENMLIKCVKSYSVPQSSKYLF